MTDKEKAIAYDNALNWMRSVYPTMTGVDKEDAEHYFPELKESEDERIKEELISLFQDCINNRNHPYNASDSERWIAWLEKQGEQKPVISNDALREGIAYFGITQHQIDNWLKKYVDVKKQDEQKPADKVEPKFKVGDWITNGIDVDKIIGIDLEDEEYLFENDTKSDISLVESISHIWTIQDAKNGDVLVNQNGEMPFIFKECKDYHIYCYCGYTNRKDVFFDRFVNGKGEELHWLNLYYEQAYPATKEQREKLEKAITAAGYEWDAEKKELKKIEQKPAWNE